MADEKRLISFSGSEFEFNGNFFKGEPGKKLKANLAVEVRKLANQGKASVVATIRANVGRNARARYPSRRSTGFTARSIEVYQDPPNSLYAKVRVKPELERPGAKATAQYPAERIPYIVMAVLETGRRGGSYTRKVTVDPFGRSRNRRVWSKGERQGGQRPLFAFRRAAREMRSYAPAIRDRVTKGID